MSEQRSIATVSHPGTAMSAFSSADAFDTAQRMAKALSASNLVPKEYQGNLANCIVALEMAQRVGASPLMVAQNLNIIHGRPSWSSSYIIAALNACGRFAPIRFRVEGDGDGKTCVAWTVDQSGEVLEGPPVSIAMAKAEGWHGKQGSKWQTMPDLMLRYRAAAFFGRLYAPDVLMGMQTAEEVQDVVPEKDVTPVQTDDAADRLNDGIADAKAKRTARKPGPVIDAEVVPTPPDADPIPVASPDLGDSDDDDNLF